MSNLNLKKKHFEKLQKRAIERKTGARGLRSIIEGIMLDVMFELPSREDVKKCVITAETVRGEKAPLLILHDGTIVEYERKTSA